MKLVLLTGFLGAGKTTLLTHLLKACEGTKIGVLMNEFGEKSIDSERIKGPDFDLMTLTNGSVFCACLKENFIKGLAAFLDYDIEMVFIEASGVADPSNMGAILETVKKINSTKTYDYLGAVCVIDGLYFLKQLEVIPALKKQIVYSSVVIINKADLQTRKKLDTIKSMIEKINPESAVYEVSFCEVPVDDMITLMNPAKKQPEDTTNTWESRPKTSVLATDEILDYQRFGTFLHEIKADTYRIKGFVKTNAGIFEVSCVNDFVVMNAWQKPTKKTELVIISSVGVKVVSRVLNAWEKHFKGVAMDFK